MNDIRNKYVVLIWLNPFLGTIKDTIVSSSKFEAIGEIELDYLVVHPIWKEGVSCDFAVTFAKHWKPHWKGIDVGHRGLGNSFTKADT